jgi:hypothetical protein
MGRETGECRGKAGGFAGVDAACHGQAGRSRAREAVKIIHAEGEFSAAQRLVDTARLLAEEPVSIQLRHVQTLTEIGVEKNTTLVFPLPVDIFSRITKGAERR